MGDKNVSFPSNLDSDLKKDGCIKRKELESSSNHPRVHSRSRSSIDNRALKKSSSRSPSRPSRKVYYRVRGRAVWEESETRGEKSRYRSRSRSRSSRRGDRYSCIRSRSHSLGRYGKSRSHSPLSSQRRHIGTREKPKASNCLGVFGLNRSTSEQQLYNLFSKFGPLDKVQLVIDRKIGRSRGFGFVFFKDSADAKVAKESCSGIQIDGRKIRVDFSITQKARTPTPKLYMDKPTKHCYSDRYIEKGSYRGRRSPSPRHRCRRCGRSRSRSYSPQKYR